VIGDRAFMTTKLGSNACTSGAIDASLLPTPCSKIKSGGRSLAGFDLAVGGLTPCTN